MTLEKKYLVVAVIAAILAVPVALAMQHRAHQLKIEKSQNHKLQLQLDGKQQELRIKNTQIEQKDQQLQEKQQQIDDAQKQLQSRRDAQAKLAAAALARQVAMTPNCASYQSLVSQYNWDVHVAMAIMQAESGCRAITPDNSAANYDGVADHGLFQLHGIDVTDPAENVRIAYHVKYLTQGWGAWNAYKNGSYLRYL